MNPKKLLALYGLKWNPFLPDIPNDALWAPPGWDHFLFRVENLVVNGGYALVSGEPGLGKSKYLQLLSSRLSRLNDVVVGVMERPQSSLGDFYREMGDLFGVGLSPVNRYGGFKALRERWLIHIKKTLYRPVLLIDEAQEMNAACLNEIRILGSADFDSRCLFTTVLSGDTRLPERFRNADLVALGSRIQVRAMLEPYEKDILLDYLDYTLKEAGAPQLMTSGLKEALADHAAGNLRVLNTMAGELLIKAAQTEAPELNEKLFMEVFSRQRKPTQRRAK